MFLFLLLILFAKAFFPRRVTRLFCVAQKRVYDPHVGGDDAAHAEKCNDGSNHIRSRRTITRREGIVQWPVENGTRKLRPRHPSSPEVELSRRLKSSQYPAAMKLVYLSLLTLIAFQALAAEPEKTASLRAIAPGEDVMNFALPDAKGRLHELRRTDAKAIVLYFTMNGCPIARQHTEDDAFIFSR